MKTAEVQCNTLLTACLHCSPAHDMKIHAIIIMQPSINPSWMLSCGVLNHDSYYISAKTTTAMF